MDQQLVCFHIWSSKDIYIQNVAKEQHSSRQYRLFATNCIVSRQMVDEKINEHLKEKISFYGLFYFTLKKLTKENFHLLSIIKIILKFSFIQYVKHVFIFDIQKKNDELRSFFFLSIRRSNRAESRSTTCVCMSWKASSITITSL